MGLCLSKGPDAPGQVSAAKADGQALVDAPKPPEPPSANEEKEDWVYRGAPRPANETERLGLLRALGVLDTEQGPDQFDAITRLLCGVFNVPIALVSLVDAERQWFKSVQGLGACMQTGREESFCAWTLLPDAPFVLVVEDALEDRRFAENPLVLGPPGIRFYAGAPLISSANGYRYGTLCVIDTKPHREFAAEQYNMLIQFAELCVREIEKDKLTMLQKMVQQTAALSSDGGGMSRTPSLRSSSAAGSVALPSHSALLAAAERGSGLSNGTRQGFVRAADCFREGVMLVDAGSSSWAILYTNDAFTVATGVTRGSAVGRGFWGLFVAPGISAASFQEAVDGSEAFTATVLLQPGRGSRPQVVDFRPAVSGQLGGQSQLIGIPPTVASTAVGPPEPGLTVTGPKYYFAILRADTPKRRASIGQQPTSPTAVVAPAGSPSSVAAAPTPLSIGGWSDGAVGSPVQDASSSAATSLAAPAWQQPNGRPWPGAQQHLQQAAAQYQQQEQLSQQGGQQNGRGSMDSDRSRPIPAFKRAMPSAFTDVRLGPLIGRGAYGRVYRGSWNGTTVAVKVIETTEPLDEDANAAPGKSGIFEAVLSTNLSHPSIVHTYQYAFRAVTAEEQEERACSGILGSGFEMGDGRPAKVATEVWLISEFCNRGPLLTAIERGAFLTQPSAQYGQPNLISVLQTLQEVAAALQYLHRNDVLHGDLTGGNVLLTASDKDTRGFTAKVVDFGLSRVCSGDYLRTRTLGCAEYMPPELITEGILTKAADVYAFGVITWELYCGRRAWEGLKPTEVLRRVASNVRLEFPLQTPHRLKVLGERCMEYVPAARPTMEEVLTEVNSILSDTMGILQQFLAASSAATMGVGPGGGDGPPGSVLAPSDPFVS